MKRVIFRVFLDVRILKEQFYIVINRIFLWTAGVKVGKGVQIRGPLRLIIKGDPKNIVIGDHFICTGPLELYNREHGRIVIASNVVFDGDIAICAAQSSNVRFEEGVRVSPDFTCNAGANVTVGRKTLIARNVSINSSDHRIARGMDIQDQGFVHGAITIKDDVWLGANVCVNKGVTIGAGSVIGANAVVASDIDDNAIAVGVPAKTVKFRE